MHGPHQADSRLRALKTEYDELDHEQIKALELAMYVGMSAEEARQFEARQFEARRRRIFQLIDEMRALERPATFGK